MRVFVMILAVTALLLAVGVPMVICAVAALIAPVVFFVARVGDLVISDAQPVALLALVSFRAPPSIA